MPEQSGTHNLRSNKKPQREKRRERLRKRAKCKKMMVEESGEIEFKDCSGVGK